MGGKKHTVGNIVAGLMLALAVIFDAVQGLLTVSVLLLPFSLFITFLSTITFSLWFALLGMSYSGRFAVARLLTLIAMTVAELAPVINALPAITAGVVGLIVLSRVEDFQKSLQPAAQEPTITDIRRARLQAARRLRSEQIAREQATDDSVRDPELRAYPAANDDDDTSEYRRAA